MKTTLADRLKEAMQGPPKVTGQALAKACGIKPPSVSDWLSGNTKRMDGVNLIHAAECLRVNPKWLATVHRHLQALTVSDSPQKCQTENKLGIPIDTTIRHA